jgi:RNA polymerase sigma factor (sigma-70 family)
LEDVAHDFVYSGGILNTAGAGVSVDLKLLQSYAQSRDAEAFSTLVATYSDMVYATCLRILKNVAEAEDASQECFLRLARDSAKVHTSLPAWLHRCATNECITRIRQSTATARRERTYEIDRQENKRSSSTWGEISDQVDEALEELPDDLRHILIAHFLQRRSQTELAKELGVSTATMSRRVSEGVTAIRKRLSRTGFVLSAFALSVVLLEHTAQAAPQTLVSSLGKMAIFGPPVAATFWTRASRLLTSKAALHVAAMAGVLGVMSYWMLRLHDISVPPPAKHAPKMYRITPTSAAPQEQN